MKNVKKDTIVFDEENCVPKMLDYLLQLKGEERKVGMKSFECGLQLNAHNGNGFETWRILKTLPSDRRAVDLIKNRKCINWLKLFKGYIQSKKMQVPQYLFFRYGMTHLSSSLKNLDKTFKTQKKI